MRRYCTEAVILLAEGKCKADMEAAVQAIVDADEADSMVCVGAPAKGGGDMVKVHVHTNAPAKIFDAATEFSKHGPKLLKEKVEDMYAEREAAHARRLPAHKRTAAPESLSARDVPTRGKCPAQSIRFGEQRSR